MQSTLIAAAYANYFHCEGFRGVAPLRVPEKYIKRSNGAESFVNMKFTAANCKSKIFSFLILPCVK
jgi:hypothetical protein